MINTMLRAIPSFKRVGYIIISTDRGLCGGLNSNLFRKLLVEIRAWQEKKVEVDIVANITQNLGQKVSLALE